MVKVQMQKQTKSQSRNMLLMTIIVGHARLLLY